MRLAIAALVLFSNLGGTLALQATSHAPSNGYVPDERTAVAIAEAVLVPIYGEKTISGEKPFHAKVTGDTWVVNGTLPAGSLGGVATVELSRKDGHIISVTHSR
ncbi:YbbC/YhhH family protein [Granulicella paludicola]|uniref:YbbC/YhhH family protein n=1 Tax=Granulicella paludicola TaxID=474951 RepID=UPI0021E009F0|nr:YbbC/YhhH family protein [Granulicella paludicola]